VRKRKQSRRTTDDVRKRKQSRRRAMTGRSPQRTMIPTTGDDPRDGPSREPQVMRTRDRVFRAWKSRVMRARDLGRTGCRAWRSLRRKTATGRRATRARRRAARRQTMRRRRAVHAGGRATREHGDGPREEWRIPRRKNGSWVRLILS
jgi:hypothetical protein